ncbi:MAG: DNA-3-methyladenine glycosylase [Saprospiraceae bacterium]
MGHLGTRLPLDFYTRTDVVQIARELLGKVLVTEFGGQRTAGRIVETEAYRAPDDRACHAFGNRRTPRTEVMFQEGGRAYIYLCYGIHHLFNIVTAPEGMAHAVLIRAIEPLEGQDIMRLRRNQQSPIKNQQSPIKNQQSRINNQQSTLTNGPGTLAQALGLRTAWSGQSLLVPDAPIWVEDGGAEVLEPEIAEGPRIGVGYAGECAAWPWRFWLKNSPFVRK